jgi:hypothetical protein
MELALETLDLAVGEQFSSLGDTKKKSPERRLIPPITGWKSLLR